jgi:DNA modification methylase
VLDQLHHGDCLEGLARLDEQSVDFVFADLPYGSTQNAECGQGVSFV